MNMGFAFDLEARPYQPREDIPTKPTHTLTGKTGDYEHDWKSGMLVYLTLGAVNAPGGALTPALRNMAIRRGAGARLALLIGLGGEWAIVAFAVGIMGAVLDPMDLYPGGLIPDPIAQAITVPLFEGAADLKAATSAGMNQNFQLDMSNWGSFQ